MEPAVASAMSVPVDAAIRHPHVVGMLRAFGSRLETIAPDTSLTHTWAQYARDTWRRPA